MEKIKKAFLIYYAYNKNIINGSIIDTFEYFYTAWEQDNNIKLIFIKSEKNNLLFIKDFISNRYSNINKNVFKSIISKNDNFFIKNIFETVFISDSTTLLNANYYFILRSKNKHIITEFNDNKFIFKDRTNVTYYSEMKDNRIPGDEYYYTKMRFDLIKKPSFQKNILFVNAPKFLGWNNNTGKEFKIKINSVVEKNGNENYILKGAGNNSNIFEEFSHYLYIKTLSWTDPRPRMFHECYYFNIPIEYYNKYGIMDGSFQRYTELMQNGLNNRFLSKDDTIIQRILND